MEMPRERALILEAIAENTGEAMMITNHNDFDWHNVTVKLNQRYVYREALAVVGSGETITLKYSDFLDDTQAGFPAGETPSQYIILSDEGTGPA